MKQKIIIILFVMAAMAYSKLIEGQMIYDTLLLGELEIMAYQADFSSTTKQQSVDSLFLDNLSHLDLGEVLSAYTPVYIRSYGKGSISTASFRGTGANHTQLIWNDFKINSPMLGQTDLSLLPVSFFDKVELYYGGSSLLKSEGGLGGHICLSSEPFNKKSPLLFLHQSVGSFNSFSTSAGLNLGKKNFNSDTRIIFHSSENDFGYFNDAIAPPQEMKQRNASYRNGGFTQQISVRPALNHVISLSSWTQWNHRNVPPIMSKAEANENVKEYEDNLFSRNTLSWVYQGKKSVLAVKTAFFYENYEYHQELHNNAQTDTLINSQNKTKGIFTRMNYTTSFNHGFSINTGLNFDYDWVNSNNYSSIKKRNTAGAFAKLEKEFIQRIKLSVLARAQFTDSEFLPIMPLLGLNLKLLKKHDLFFRSSISRNYHLPTLNDLYWNPGGNKNLKPEDGYEVEAGLNYIFSSVDKLLFKTDLTFYATKINNWIQWVDTGTAFWTPQNISVVFSRGLEFSAQLQGMAGRLSYLIYGQYAYTRTTNISQAAIERSTDAQQLIYIPEHAANGYLNVGLYGFSFEWQIHYVGEQNTIGARLPAFVLNDLSLGKAWKLGKSSLNIRAKANNILNTQYQSVSSRAMPGRNYELIVKYILNQ